MATQITANLPTLNFPREMDYPTQEDWAAFSAAAELNFGILGNDWSTQMQLWKTQANAMSIELNNNADLAQSIANYQGDWTSKGYTLGQTVSVSGVYYICKLTHATGQNPTTGGSLYWNIALGNWNLKVNNYGNETIAGVKTFSSSPIVPTPTANTQAANKQYADLKVALADFTGTNVSFGSNGYQKLPSGLIIQWGTTAGTTDPNGNFQIAYPITFPNLNFFCVFSLGDKIASVASSSVSLSNNISVFGKNSMNINASTYTNINYSLSSLRINWLVIGY